MDSYVVSLMLLALQTSHSHALQLHTAGVMQVTQWCDAVLQCTVARSVS
jgi:hypothetical protein